MVRLTILFIIFSITACGDKSMQQELAKENAALKRENEILRKKQRTQEASISGYRRTLEEIDFNLRKVELNWTLINDLELEAKSDKEVEARINKRILFIDNLFRNTNLKIQLLDKNLNNLRKDSNSKSEEILTLDKMLKNSAKTLLEQKEDYEKRTKALEVEIDDLEKVYQQQKAYTDELRKMLNRAYFYSGTKKELKENKIVDNTGGFIGIGKVKILNAKIDDIGFSQIEKDKVDQFTVASNKIKLITNHPKSSYTQIVNGSSTKLSIIDKNAFWKAGNYLIIQTN